MFTFVSLLGAQSESSASQSILELDGGVKVLIDVGWDESFDVAMLRELEKQVPTLSFILLTHATVAHLAAFAHCCKHFPLFTQIPIYATLPVIQLGRTLLQDLYTSTPLASTIIPASALSEGAYSYSQPSSPSEDHQILLLPPTGEEIASYFSLVTPLKYKQTHNPIPSPFSPPLNGLSIAAHNAGHTLGGTIWHILHGTESIVYAVDWSLGRENVLAGAAWIGERGGEIVEQLRKPTALICSSRGADRLALPGGRAKRDELLLDMIKSTIRKGGIVLIPTDSSARVLELAYLLEHAWRTSAADDDSPLRTSKLYLASNNIGATMRYTRSMLEWMDPAIVREFESVAGGQQKQQNGQQDSRQSQQGAGPFDFKHLRLLERKGQIDSVLNENETDSYGRSVGKVILASDISLEWGFSKEVLRKIADDRRNLVILTEKVGVSDATRPPTGIARTLWKWLEERRDGVASEEGTNNTVLEQVYSGGREVEVRHAKREPLEGNDLAVYQQWMATQHQLQTTLQIGGATAHETTVDVVDDASSDSSSDSDDSETEQQGKAINISTTMGQAGRKKIGLSDEDLGVNILLHKKGVYDYDVRGKKGREKMFPLAIRRRRNDDYGEVIRADEYLRDEEKDEVDGQDARQPGRYDTKDTLGKKRKWDDVAPSNDRRMANGGIKRQPVNDFDQRNSPDIADINGDDQNYVVEPEEIIGPSRVVISRQMLQVNLRLAFVDFAGLHDKRSLQMLIPLIQPRKLILVGGVKTETLTLAEDCRKLLAAEGSTVVVFAPEVGVSVDASVDTNTWAVKLTDALVKRIRWQKLTGMSIVTLTGRLGAAHVEHDSQEGHKKQKMLKEEAEDLPMNASSEEALARTVIPTLDIIPLSMASSSRAIAQPLHVGELRIPELRKHLIAANHTADLQGGGALLVDGTVVVRKSGSRIEVESIGLSRGGNMQRGSSFYAVKARIYESLAVITGQ